MAVLLRRSGRQTAAVSSAPLRRRALRMLRALGLPQAELSVVLCDDAFIRELNRRHRQLDRATDVLSFAMLSPRALRKEPPSGALLGDVVISVPTAVRQARAKRKAPLHEATFLLAHGLLHLLGFDHRTPTEERRMNALADGLLGAALTPGRAAVDRLGAARPTRRASASREPRMQPKKSVKSKA
jgi:probable rRNA maturation factor